MKAMIWIAGVVIVLLVLLVLTVDWHIPAGRHEAMVAASIKITGEDVAHGLPDLPVRIVFCGNAGWQDAAAGQRFTTNADGEDRVTVQATFDRQWRKMPNSFVNFLISVPQRVEHLAVGVELEYMGTPCLYVADLELFPDGTTLRDDFSVYTRDAQGRYTMKAAGNATSGWSIPTPSGAMLNTPGYEVSTGTLVHEGEKWTLHLDFKKHAAAVMR